MLFCMSSLARRMLAHAPPFSSTAQRVPKLTACASTIETLVPLLIGSLVYDLILANL